MKKYLLLFLLFAGTVHAQTLIPGLRNPTDSAGQVPTSNADGTVTWRAAPSGGGSAKMFYSNTANVGTVYNYGASLLPFVYSPNGASHAPSLYYYNAGIIGDSGTLKNWYLRMDSTGVAEYDTCILYRSTNGGVTWTATSFQILFGSGTAQSRPMASDVTHTLSVAPGDMLYMQFTAGSVSGSVGLAVGVASSIEFDPQ